MLKKQQLLPHTNLHYYLDHESETEFYDDCFNMAEADCKGQTQSAIESSSQAVSEVLVISKGSRPLEEWAVSKWTPFSA